MVVNPMAFSDETKEFDDFMIDNRDDDDDAFD